MYAGRGVPTQWQRFFCRPAGCQHNSLVSHIKSGVTFSLAGYGGEHGDANQVWYLGLARKAEYFASGVEGALILVAAVANSYYALWADRWQLALTEQTLQTRQDSFKLLQLKFDNGVLNELDLRSGQSLVEAARITKAQAQRQWAQDLSALNLLLGTTASADLLPPVPTVNMALSKKTPCFAHRSKLPDVGKNIVSKSSFNSRKMFRNEKGSGRTAGGRRNHRSRFPAWCLHR